MNNLILNKAVATYAKEHTTEYHQMGISSFLALFGILGMDELHDGICTAMQDAGYEEIYEDIMYLTEEVT